MSVVERQAEGHVGGDEVLATLGLDEPLAEKGLHGARTWLFLEELALRKPSTIWKSAPASSPVRDCADLLANAERSSVVRTARLGPRA